ncbi:5-deoxy-glucuronate isomerase [Rhodococcus sp. IEGM 1381]|uniref:5-deoxy-glucuronate isomerase n=1 Tax=Rhodococcus sp. IEGM 1381 TaxID=3047085 RepID=UPI0024B76811|nr:5-deoxy-glucuronate isomerase [Rhodococcus sp. IEGM 1381]MDI9894551.1 5-deoxy-glucuronate isomerase [Rhodococcus sp. IEGM 1381]
MNSQYYIAAGSGGKDGFDVAVTPESADWTESSLWTITLAPGESVDLNSAENEIMIVPLSGSATVTSEGTKFDLVGRASVFDGPTDFVYVGRDSVYAISTVDGGRFALCGARAGNTLPFRYVPAVDISVELRGAGNCSRQVHNFGTADTFEADSLIACEVITPGGNWSSYPGHKHDENTANESALEEIYYFEIAPGPDDSAGFGYHRVYGTPQRPIEVLEEVRSGDVVLVPHGYHGPSVAAPGYHMYYLNVMAGPGKERAWNIVDDPEHTWIRSTWTDQPVDPRLPLHSSSTDSASEGA